MSYRIGLKPGKAVSVLGMVVGGIFVLLGVTIVIPTFGTFGFLWTAGAGAIAVFYAYNFFSRTGISAYRIDVDSPDNIEDLDANLRKLAKLKEDGLISDREYEQKRAEIMQRK
jgi:hypothetical protein